MSASLPSPQHVAIIMDGNGRWAKQRGMPRTAGHRAGLEALKKTLENARDLGVRYLTVYSFSSENWKRPEDEVSELMGLLRHYLKSETDRLVAQGIRLHVIGERARLPDDIKALIEKAETATAINDKFHFIVALSYGGRQEIISAARKIAQKAKAGEIDPSAVDEAVFAAHLDTVGIPDPDLLIRTSGESRISNFLLWQLAYAEMIFLPIFWPDFDRSQFEGAIAEFCKRDRRFGGVK